MDLSIIEQIGRSSKKVVFLFNLGQQNFDFLNKTAAHVWEINLPSILASPGVLLSSIHPEDVATLQHIYQQALSGTIQDITFRLCFPENVVKHIHADVFPLTDPQNKVYAL